MMEKDIQENNYIYTQNTRTYLQRYYLHRKRRIKKQQTMATHAEFGAKTTATEAAKVFAGQIKGLTGT